MSLDEDTLHAVAQNGEMDWSKWPSIIDPLLERLNQIVYHEFPMPRPYPTLESLNSQSHNAATGTPSHNQSIIQITQTPTTPRALPPVPAFPGSSAADTTTSHVPNSQPDQPRPLSNNDIDPELPILLLQQLNSIVATLRASFYTRPPHTIQRLSELTLDPRRHYKSLPAWLRAVDRVVSVSSTADIFPLTDTPPVINGINGDGAGGILWNNGDHNRNGIDGRDRDGGLGSDESLGGALLTPIPWLREVDSNTTNETDSTNGDMDGTGVGADTTADDLLGDEIQLPPSTITPTTPSTSTNTPTTETSDTSDPTTILSQPQGPSASLTLASHVSDPLVPDRPLGAVTQGELIRMEQEAGVIPVSHSASSSSLPRTGRTEHSPSITLGVGVGLDGDRSSGGDGGERDEMLGSDSSESSTPHARGPHTVGTVDMGLVGGKGVEVKLDDKSNNNEIDVNVHDAQNVLAGGTPPKTRKQNGTDKGKDTSDDEKKAGGAVESASASEEGYVDVAKEVVGPDEMQVDEEQSSTQAAKKDVEEGVEEDGDIVLVDADGATEEERAEIDESGVNVGSSTADGTTR